MRKYIDIVEEILLHGKKKTNRTGIETSVIPGMIFRHDMSEGFPLLTSKFIPFNLVASELQFFLNGITDKKWLQDRGNNIWDDWCNPKKVRYKTDTETKLKMKTEKDLGPIYGFQWRNFGGTYLGCNRNIFPDGVDQVKRIVKTLKKDPDDRRMIVSAWNPIDLDTMALPPCHYAFQITVDDGFLNLFWNQRSVDVALGLPFNIASYGLLLLLFCKESGFKPGILTGFLADTHIYENHREGLKEQITRALYPLPTVDIPTESFSIFTWDYRDVELKGYNHGKTIKFEIAV